MPQIPGVSSEKTRAQTGFRAMRFIGFFGGLVLCLLLLRWVMLPKRQPAPPPAPPPRIEVPAPAADIEASLPHATPAQPEVAETDDMAPWAAKEFFYKNRLSGENLPAMLVRLPIGSASQARSYWAFSLRAPFGNCRLEYITKLDRLKNEYGFKDAEHPMVGNPCSRTLYDPLKLMSIPGDVWVRGAIAQGSDLRPPLAIEVEIRDKQILVSRME
jgi:hypothetical protein